MYGNWFYTRVVFNQFPLFMDLLAVRLRVYLAFIGGSLLWPGCASVAPLPSFPSSSSSLTPRCCLSFLPSFIPYSTLLPFLSTFLLTYSTLLPFLPSLVTPLCSSPSFPRLLHPAAAFSIVSSLPRRPNSPAHYRLIGSLFTCLLYLLISTVLARCTPGIAPPAHYAIS